MKQTHVLFVCLGNICRSPTTQAVFEKKALERGLRDWFVVDSAGTGDWHLGEPPHERTVLAAQRAGYDLSCLRARQVRPEDFQRFDFIFAMDESNLGNLRREAPRQHHSQIALFLEYAGMPRPWEVPDPYGGGMSGFQRVLALIERACECLLDRLCEYHQQEQNPVS